MQDAIISTPAAPKTTLSVDSIVYIGQNQIRRNIGKTTSLYEGVQTVDRILLVPKADFVEITETLPVSALVIDTDSAVTLTLNNTVSIEVRKHFMCDSPSIQTIKIANASTTADANVRVTYLS